MALWTDIVDPSTLTGFVRADVADYEANTPTLARFLPNDVEDDIYVRYTSGGSGLLDAASFRSYDTENVIQSGPPRVRQSLELPPLGSKESVSEYDQLRQQGRDSDESVLNVIEKVAIRRARATADRLELARGVALNLGAVAISENGVVTTADFGRSGSHSVTATIPWSTYATSVPLTDLTAWCQVYRDDTGQDPGAILLSSAAITAMQRSAEVKALLTGVASPNLVSIDNVNAALSSYNLPPIVRYDRNVRVAGTNQRVIPANRAILLPAPVDPQDAEGTQLGRTVWGRTLESMEPEYDIPLGDQPGLVVGAYRNTEGVPHRVWVEASAIGFPVLANPDLSFAATVL